MLRSILLVAALATALGCDNMVSVSGAPLDENECGQLMDKIHEIMRVGLTGEDLEWFDQTHLDDRPDSVRECVEDPAWDRAGFQCAMKAGNDGALQRCVMRF